MKDKMKQVRADKQPKSLIPKGIKSFTEKPADTGNSVTEACFSQPKANQNKGGPNHL